MGSAGREGSSARRRQRWGPWLALAGYLIASLGGLTNTDCFLCTWTELVPTAIGSLVMLVGVAMALLRHDRRRADRVLAVVLVACIMVGAAVTVRMVLPPLLWESPHAETTSP